jgi:hypothetical protein
MIESVGWKLVGFSDGSSVSQAIAVENVFKSDDSILVGLNFWFVLQSPDLSQEMLFVKQKNKINPYNTRRCYGLGVERSWPLSKNDTSTDQYYPEDHFVMYVSPGSKFSTSSTGFDGSSNISPSNPPFASDMVVVGSDNSFNPGFTTYSTYENSTQTVKHPKTRIELPAYPFIRYGEIAKDYRQNTRHAIVGAVSPVPLIFDTSDSESSISCHFYGQKQPPYAWYILTTGRNHVCFFLAHDCLERLDGLSVSQWTMFNDSNIGSPYKTFLHPYDGDTVDNVRPYSTWEGLIPCNVAATQSNAQSSSMQDFFRLRDGESSLDRGVENLWPAIKAIKNTNSKLVPSGSLTKDAMDIIVPAGKKKLVNQIFLSRMDMFSSNKVNFGRSSLYRWISSTEISPLQTIFNSNETFLALTRSLAIKWDNSSRNLF